MQVRLHHLRRHIIDATNAVPTLHIAAELTKERLQPHPRLLGQGVISDETCHNRVDDTVKRTTARRRSLRHVGTPYRFRPDPGVFQHRRGHHLSHDKRLLSGLVTCQD